jgi:hypothetical protein
MELKHMASMKEISKWLVILGGIVGLLTSILEFLGIFSLGIGLGGADNIIGVIVVVIMALIALATSGVIDIKALKMEFNFIVLLIVGIVMALFGGLLGGVLIIIGALLLLLK